MAAGSLEQHAQHDTPLLSCSHGAGAQQQAGPVQQCGQPQTHVATAAAEGDLTKGATGEEPMTMGSLSQKQQQQRRQPDGVQQHSPSSRLSAVHSPRRHHDKGSMPWPISLAGCSTSTSSQQASNCVKGDSRHATPSARPTALLVTHNAQASRSSKHGAKSARHASASGHPVPSQKLLDQSEASTPSTGTSASESTVPQGKERPGRFGWPARAKRDGWADEGNNSTTEGISSSNSSTLDQLCMDAASSVHQVASQSMMVPLELPSPMPDSSSEGTALPIRS